MKKIFSFMMVLCLVASANALPIKKMEVIKPSTKDDARLAFMQHNTANLPAEKFDIDFNADRFKFGQNRLMTANPMKRMANAQTYNVSIKEGYALYLTTMYWIYAGYNPGYLWVLIFKGNKDEYIELDFDGYAADRIQGYYRDVPGAISVTAGDTVEISGDLQIDFEAKGTGGSSPKYKYTGKFTDDKGNTYNISGSYAFPSGEVLDYGYAIVCEQYQQYCDKAEITLADKNVTSEGKMDISISKSATKLHMSKENAWYFAAKDDKFYASVQVYTDSLGGEFTTKDINYAYTQLISLSGDTTVVDLYKPLSVKIEDTKDTIYCKLSMLGLDATTYNISMFYAKPACKDTVNISLNGDLYFYSADEMLQVQAYNEAEDSIFSIMLYADSKTGTFTEKDMYPSNKYTYLLINKKQYAADNFKAVIKADSKEAKYVAEITFNAYNVEDASDNHCFMVKLALFNPFEYDATTDLNVTYEVALKDIFDSSNFKKHGIVYIFSAEENKYQFYTVAFPSKLNTTTVIPEGTYQFAYSGDKGTVIASAGLDEEGNFTYSYYYDIVKKEVWFLTDGYMYMEKDQLVFEAQNMNGKEINITFKFKSTDLQQVLEESNGKTMKVVDNGRIYILRDNKAYDMFGARVK